MADVALALPSAMEDSRVFRQMFDESRTTAERATAQANQARDYYDDKQLDSAMRKKLLDRGQPPTIRNRIKPAVNGVLGVLEQNKVDPRAYPRNPPDEQGADVVSKVLRYVSDASRFHKVKLDVAENHLIEGCAGCIVEYVDGNVTPRRIRFEEFFYDPRSREADYADARWLGIAKWMYADDLAAIYPHFEDDIGTVASQGMVGVLASLDEDKPQTANAWVDKKLRRVLSVEMYHRDRGAWRRTVFFAGGILEDGPSPYTESVEGQDVAVCPIEGSSCFIDRENRRYGIVQSMIPLQDELNARASRLLHLANTRQIEVSDPATAVMVDADVSRKEASRADGVIPMGWRVSPTNDMQAGNAAILQEVASEIDRQAPTPAVLGRNQQDSSGRAKLVLQQAGMTELARALGRLEDWENRVYRQIWLRCKQFKTEPWFVRVTDDEQAFSFVQVNEPEYEMEPVHDEFGPVIDQETGQPEMQKVMALQPVKGPDGQPAPPGPDGQPRMAPQPILKGYKHRLLDMDMDIEVDTVPDTANLAAEVFQGLTQLSQYGVQAYGFKPWMDALMYFNPLPGKAEVKAILEKGAQAQQAQQQAGQAAQQAAAQAEDARKNAETQASVGLKGAQADHQQALAVLAQHEQDGQHIENAANIAQNATPAVLPTHYQTPALNIPVQPNAGY